MQGCSDSTERRKIHADLYLLSYLLLLGDDIWASVWLVSGKLVTERRAKMPTYFSHKIMAKIMTFLDAFEQQSCLFLVPSPIEGGCKRSGKRTAFLQASKHGVTFYVSHLLAARACRSSLSSTNWL